MQFKSSKETSMEACKVAAAKIRTQMPTLVSLTVFLLVVALARGADWKAALGKLIPLAALTAIYFAYQTIKARRMLLKRPPFTKSQLFFRFYLTIALLFFSYFGLSIFWEWRGHGDEAFSMLIPVFLICGVLSGVVLYRELRDLPEDFEN